jgi:site-specific DNA-methyltransferase (adenine-specific)
MTRQAFSLDHRDAVEWLRAIADESVDLAITDPPYESLEKHRAVGTTTRLKHSKSSSNDWFQIFPNSRFPELFAELYRVLKRDTHLYLFCDPETAFVAKPIGEAAGFKFWKPIVWSKLAKGMGYHYRASYEFILFFEKGKRMLHDLGQGDVIECKRIRNGYPTEKPAEVSEILVHNSTDADLTPPALVIDPFCGSSSVGAAALRLGRRFAGCDVSDAAIQHSRDRLCALGAEVVSAWVPKAQQSLFDAAPSATPRRVSPEEYDAEFERRREALDQMPGGAQGANPDMSDLEEDE